MEALGTFRKATQPYLEHVTEPARMCDANTHGPAQEFSCSAGSAKPPSTRTACVQATEHMLPDCRTDLTFRIKSTAALRVYQLLLVCTSTAR